MKLPNCSWPCLATGQVEGPVSLVGEGDPWPIAADCICCQEAVSWAALASGLCPLTLHTAPHTRAPAHIHAGVHTPPDWPAEVLQIPSGRCPASLTSLSLPSPSPPAALSRSAAAPEPLLRGRPCSRAGSRAKAARRACGATLAPRACPWTGLRGLGRAKQPEGNRLSKGHPSTLTLFFLA